MHLVKAAKTFTEKSLLIKDCPTETKIQISDHKIQKTQKYFNKNKFNIVIGAGSSGPDTRWGNQNYINLINQLNLIGEYFYTKNQKEKAREFYNQILILNNANNEIKLESKKRINRDLSE